MKKFKEHDVVKISQLIALNRHFNGTENIKREPMVGDVGTIVGFYEFESLNPLFIVEMVNKDGFTVWIADFLSSELELVEKA